MTAIAAIRTFGVPTLLSDLLVTSKGNPRGLHRKLEQINDQVWIAWSGQVAAAEHLIPPLVHFGQDARDPTALAQAFEAIPYREIPEFDLSVVGWMVGADPRPFRWSTAEPNLEWDRMFVSGSGGSIIEEGLPDGGFCRNDGTVWDASVDAEEDLEFTLAAAACQLVAHDIFYPTYQDQWFGGGFEIAIAPAGRFRFVSEIQIIPTEIQLDQHGVISTVKSTGLLQHYSSDPEASVVYNYDVRENRTDVHLMRPLTDWPGSGRRADRILGLAKRGELKFPRSPNWWAIFLRFHDHNGVVLPPVSFVISAESPQASEWIQFNPGLTIALPGDLLARILSQIQRDIDEGMWPTRYGEARTKPKLFTPPNSPR